MTVVCSKCNSRFQLKADSVPEAGRRVRCSNCDHRFVVKPPPRAGKAQAPIRSLLEDDADLLDIVQDFANQIPDRIRNLKELYSQDDRDELQRVAHQLKGGAGGVGFPQISDVAAALEQAIKSKAKPEQIQERVIALTQILAAVRVPGSQLESGLDVGDAPESPPDSDRDLAKLKKPALKPGPKTASPLRPAGSSEPVVDKVQQAVERMEQQTKLIAETVQKVDQLSEELASARDEQRKAQAEIRGALRALLKQLSGN